MHVDCLQDCFVVSKNKVILCKRKVISLITDYIIPVYCCQNKSSIINFTIDDMTSKFELFSRNKINNLYQTESVLKAWMQLLDKYWNERDRPLPDYFEFCPDWLFQYYNELTLSEFIESVFLVWKSEKHKLTPKYYIMH